MLEGRKLLAEVTNCRQLFEFLCSSQKHEGGGHYLFPALIPLYVMYFTMYSPCPNFFATFNTFYFPCKDWNFVSAKFVSMRPQRRLDCCYIILLVWTNNWVN